MADLSANVNCGTSPASKRLQGSRGVTQRVDQLPGQHPQSNSSMPKATSAAEALSPAPTEEDRRYDATLRPTRLTDYVGQRKEAENLRVYIKAPSKRRETLDHDLLTGPPLLAKTTLSHIV